VTMKKAVFWNMWLCRYCVNRRFRETYRPHLPGRKTRERGIFVSMWLQTDLPELTVPSLTTHIPSHPLKWVDKYLSAETIVQWTAALGWVGEGVRRGFNIYGSRQSGRSLLLNNWGRVLWFCCGYCALKR
jgi:hypothetical protein